MNDVARAAGVGLKTVSRVVNGEPGVHVGTAELVRAAIEELGFRRNEGARVLRRGNTASIGLILEDVSDPFYSILTRAVEEVAREHHSLVFTGSSGEDPEREREVALAFCARRVDGLAIVPADGDHSYLIPEIEAGTAVVAVDRPATGLNGGEQRVSVDVVLTDNAGGVRQGIRHLLSYGHRRIGYIGDAPRIFTAAERLRGYREALAEAGVPIDPTLIHMGHPSEKAVREALAALLDGPQPTTALFTGNNRITVAVLRELTARRASGVSRAARARGQEPTGPALVGFDDFELADVLEPGITVVAQDPARMGHAAAELLFQRLGNVSGPDVPVSSGTPADPPGPPADPPGVLDAGRADHVELPTWLIPRGSGEQHP